MIRRALTLVLGSLLASACANLSTLQTARTLPVDERRYHVGLGMFSVPDTSDGGGHRGRYPYLEGSVRRGVTDKLELGGKATLMGSLSADAKYKLIEHGKFAFATGLGFGLLSYGLINTDTKQNSAVTFFDLMLPFYISQDITSNLTLYASPKYVYRVGNLKFFDTSDDNTHTLAGAGGGVQIKFSEKEGLFVEGTYMHYLGRKERTAQLNTAFYFQ